MTKSHIFYSFTNGLYYSLFCKNRGIIFTRKTDNWGAYFLVQVIRRFKRKFQANPTKIPMIFAIR